MSELTDAQDPPHIILASASPRRADLLDQIGVRYLIRPVDVDERVYVDESPEHYVQRIAAEKSHHDQQISHGEMPVLGADTAVVIDGEILGKPRDRNHALVMLERLAGRTHHVLSAVSLRGDKHWQALSVTRVTFCPIETGELEDYWATGEPLDKAGGYAIQGLGALFVARIEGSFSGVVGLPLFETARLLRLAGVFR